ncbi:hypothetical protein [Vibrio vulnificus]|uniref:hypothetical protein n=1 Tax=Vibrio vulnificus TaxID=672 RepID=UPI003D9A1C16
MPRGIFGMRLVLVVKWSAESWFKRHSPLNAALGAVRNFLVQIFSFSLAICSGFFGNLALSSQVLESLNP